MQHQYKPVGLLLVSYIPHWLNLVSDPLPYIVDHKRELKRKDLERHSGCSGGGGRGQIEGKVLHGTFAAFANMHSPSEPEEGPRDGAGINWSGRCQGFGFAPDPPLNVHLPRSLQRLPLLQSDIL